MSDDDRLKKELEPIRSVNPSEPDRVDVEKRVMAAAATDPGSLLRAYRALPDAAGGRYVSADLMKEVFADYSASREARGRYNNVVHNSAAVLASTQFREAIQDKGDLKRTEALFITGAPGAGKTSAVLSYGIPDDARIVYEGQLVDKSSHDKISAALKAGLNVNILAVMPLIETALENTMRRFDNVGRGASIATMARIHDKTPEALRTIHERFGNRVLIEVVDNRDVRKSISLDYAEGVKLWQQEIERGRTTERLQTHLEVMRREGRTSVNFELQANGTLTELGREYSVRNAQIGNQSGRVGEDRKAGVLGSAKDASLSAAEQLAAKFRTTPQLERLNDPKLNAAAKVLAVANAHIDAAFKPDSNENQRARKMVIHEIAANIARGRVYAAPKFVRTVPERTNKIVITQDKSRDRIKER